jgi:hypothetical protein
MKKLINVFAILGVVFGLASCKCSNEAPSTNEESDIIATSEINVEHAISTDRQAMYVVADGADYRWFETDILLKNYLDEENDGSIEMLVNIFQVAQELDEHSFDVRVYKFQHTEEGTVSDWVSGFWIEDEPLNDEAIKITYKEAYEKVMAVNLPKPHTKHVVLRKQVGPVDANAQWIFGNIHAQIYVDAVTGEVSDENPVFKALGFKMPLGEWP